MNFKPIFDRVVIDPQVEENVSKSGIVLPQTSQEKPQVGIVVAIGDGENFDCSKTEMRVEVGNKVKVLDMEYDEECEYRVVGSTEADPRNGLISDESPVGRALIGKKQGDEVIVEAPAGEFKLKILKISK